MKQTKETLKTYFETGDKPTQGQFRDLIDSFVNEDEVLEILDDKAVKEYPHEYLNSLVNSEKLVVGQKYVLSDYQTKYYIEGTDTAPIEKQITNEAIVSGHGFYNPPLPDLVIGFEVEVVSLPQGYSGSITVGQKTKVTRNSSNYYLQFENGLHWVIGAVFRYSKQRYDSVVSGSTVLDANYKVMMQEGGVINTDVHDGMPYMEMTAEENTKVPFEKILLTAITKKQFSLNAESLTFPGETLEYDFTNTEIKNENEKVIGYRKGLITRRISADKKIDIDKDWRVQRYRRYRMSEIDWKNYILAKPLYNLGANPSCTLANISTKESHRFILPYIEMKNFFQDFSGLGKNENIFITGTTNSGGLVYGGMMEAYNDDAYKQNVTASAINNGKDFFIFPMDNYEKITAVCVNKLENTVFMNYPSQFAQKNTIEVKITDGISESTFVSGGVILSSSENKSNALLKITAVDNIQLKNKGNIHNLNVLATSTLNNCGAIYYLTIGGMPSDLTGFGATYVDVSFDALCRVRNTIIGGKRVDRMFFSNVQTNKCLFTFSRGQFVKFSDSIMFLTGVMLGGDFFSNNLTLDTTIINERKKAYGFLYEYSSSLYGRKIFTNNLGDLLYQVIDGLQGQSTSLVTVTNCK